MEKTCRQCNSVFSITASDQDFYKRMEVPPPTLCPRCRLQRRYNMRNERVLYRRHCDLTGAPIVTIFSPQNPHTVYSPAAWWSDQWDQLKFGRAVNFEESIFKQMKALQLQQPRIALLGKDSENSEYTNHSASNKNCYLGFSVMHCEDVLYGFMNLNSTTLVDCSFMYDNCELGYESFYCHTNYRCAYVSLCRGCTNVWFSFDLSGCEHCFLSYNLRNKKYCFLNQQLTQADYEAKVSEYKTMTFQQQQALIQQWQTLIATQAIHQASFQIQATDSTGDRLTKCHNVQEGYYVSEAENSSYVYQAERIKDCYDTSSIAPGEFCYEMTGVINSNHSKFVNYSYDNTFLEYCDHVFNSQHLLACVGLNRQKYCILNKQYSEPEYQRLREKVVAYMKTTGEHGEFFPLWYSPFDYNETVSYELFPLSKDQALALGATWNDALTETPVVSGGISANELPDTIAEVDDTILNQTIICAVSGKPYKIMPTELYVYRQLGIPLPRKHPDVRYKERMRQRVKPGLYARQCAQCHQPVSSSFAPDQSEKIYCKQCYREAVY